MSDRHETVLPDPPAETAAALQAALDSPPEGRKPALAAVVADHPTFVEGWAYLAQHADEAVERYAYARVGYHRGLDALRAHGWGGRGYVRWSQPSNRGFLRCLVRLREAAGAIGEHAEVERITGFLHELDPDWEDDAAR